MIGTLPAWAEQVKFLLGAGGLIWSFFKGYNYVKTALGDTQKGVEAIQTELSEQTKAIVSAAEKQTSELTGMRADVRMLVQSMLTPPPRARAARAARRKK